MIRFVIRKSKDGQYYWEIQAGGNWETVATSETYRRKVDCEAAIELVKKAIRYGSGEMVDKAALQPAKPKPKGRKK